MHPSSCPCLHHRRHVLVPVFIFIHIVLVYFCLVGGAYQPPPSPSGSPPTAAGPTLPYHSPPEGDIDSSVSSSPAPASLPSSLSPHGTTRPSARSAPRIGYPSMGGCVLHHGPSAGAPVRADRAAPTGAAASPCSRRSVPSRSAHGLGSAYLHRPTGSPLQYAPHQYPTRSLGSRPLPLARGGEPPPAPHAQTASAAHADPCPPFPGGCTHLNPISSPLLPPRRPPHAAVASAPP
jgi:hypothetical protein